MSARSHFGRSGWAVRRSWTSNPDPRWQSLRTEARPMSVENLEVSVDPSVVPEKKTQGDGLEVRPMRGQVLVVEDDPAHRELLVELLSVWGYEPIPVGSAEEAEYAMRRKALRGAVVDVFL